LAPQARAARLREEGNELFKSGDFEGALTAYTLALRLPAAPGDRAVLHRNRAACHLKLEDYPKAEADASRAIEADGGDVKALFRRSQALEKLGRLDQAVLDLKRCVSLEPKNRVFQEAMRALGSQIQEKVCQSTDSKVEQMFKILLDPEEKGTEKKQKNLIVLAREDAGAEKIFQSDGARLLLRLLDTGEADLMLAALRTLVGLCSEHQARTVAILSVLGTRRVVGTLGAESPQVSLAACHLLQVMFDALKEGTKKNFGGKEGAIILLIGSLLEVLTQAGIPAQGRDNALTLLIKVVPRKSLRDPDNGLALWVIDHGKGPDPRGGAVTENTRMSASVLLNKYHDHHSRSWFEGQGPAGKLRAIQTVSCLLQGPSEAGNRALELGGVMEGVIALCASERETEQLLAVETLIHAAGKAKRASFITANGVALLKDLYKRSDRDTIRIRALVGLCKLGSAGGTDISMKQFAEAGPRRSVEGLAYLTFDADVKEELVEDEEALKAMFQLGQVATPAWGSGAPPGPRGRDPPEARPEALALRGGRGAGSAGAGTVVAQGGGKSGAGCQGCPGKTAGGRDAPLGRGLPEGGGVVWDGPVGARRPQRGRRGGDVPGHPPSPPHLGLSVPLSARRSSRWLLEGTDTGQTKAAQALMTFPGREVDSPSSSSLLSDLTAPFSPGGTELGLTSPLISVIIMGAASPRAPRAPRRQKILKEKAVPMIEGYMFEEHEMIRRAATECMCNMAMSKEVRSSWPKGTTGLKLLVLYCGEDDELLRRAAAGGLAMLTACCPRLCARIPQVTTHWLEILQALLLSPSAELQHRGAVVALNMMEASRELAAALMESEALEISRPGQGPREPAPHPTPHPTPHPRQSTGTAINELRAWETTGFGCLMGDAGWGGETHAPLPT
uniref:Unc-45 myosin chaperone A n=1 Tax=Ornithorhynchus anatinus TaxID=9258 RepID=F6SH46_ORNAN